MGKKREIIIYRIIMASVVVFAAGAVLSLGAIRHGRMARKEEEIRYRAQLPVRIESCLIDGESGETVVKALVDEIPESDDEYLYLFALCPYEEEIGEGRPYLLLEGKGEEVEFRLETGVYDKFVVGVKDGGFYKEASVPHYVTNPGAMAVFTSNGEKPSGKKGLLNKVCGLLIGREF